MKNSKDKLIAPYLNFDIPLEERIDDLISRMSLEEKIKILPTHQEAIKRLNVNEYNVGGEAAHGVVTKLGNATVFPQPIGLSSTWDENLLKDIGSVIGDEARIYYEIADRKCGLTLWAPTIDMERDPRWGRTEEAYGEDPCLTGKLSSNLIKGMQGDHEFYLKLVPAPKHFYANNHEDGRTIDSSSVDPRNKHEYYLKAFKSAFVEGKAYSMMTAYNEINGTPCIVNKEVQNIVKDQWGFNGFIVCDGGDMSQTVELHKYYKTHAETISEGIKSGIDCFTDTAELVVNSAREALERGLITEKDIDKAIRNIFRVRFKLGEFDPKELNPYANISKSKLCSKEHNDLALKAAKESLVLLKNENNFLPLKVQEIQRIAVIGPLSDVIYRDWYTGTHPYKVTPLQGIKNALNNKQIVYASGHNQVIISSNTNNKALSVNTEYKDKVYPFGSPDNTKNIFELEDWGFGSYTLKSKKNEKYLTTDDKNIFASSPEVFGWFVKEVFNLIPCNNNSFNLKTWDNRYVVNNDALDSLCVTDKNPMTSDSEFTINTISKGIDEAVKAAKECDVSIVFVGNNPLVNGKEEIDRKELILPQSQRDLIKAVYETNPNTVVVILGSYPFAIKWENDNIPAILYSAHGCQEVGTAIASALFGDYSPAGRLSMTWYNSVNDLPDIKDYDIIKGKRTYMYFDKKPLYPFGHGLSYSNFSYSNLEVSSNTVSPNDNIDIAFNVKNTGDINSDEVVQLYVYIEDSIVIRPIKELKNFKRINLNPGETKNVVLNLKIEDLSFWDVTRDKFTVERGNYVLMIGSSSQDIRLETKVFVDGEIIKPRDLNKITKAENYDDYNNVILHECKEGGTCICDIKENGWVCFKNVEFKNQYKYFEFRTACESNDGHIDILIDSIDGQSIGKVNVNNTGNPQIWSTQRTSIATLSGIHDIYIKLSGSIKLSWFIFI